MTVKVTDWGPHGWKFIHYVTMFYPKNPTEQDKLNYKNFLTLIGKVLPCRTCNEHYTQHLYLYPLTDEVLANNDNLVRWSIDMHNEVNKLHGEKIFGYEEAIELIKNNFKSEPTQEVNKEYNIKPKVVIKQKEKKSNGFIYFLLLIALIFISCIIILGGKQYPNL